MTKQTPTAKHAKHYREAPAAQKAATFSDHIRELRRRFLLVALLLVVVSGLAYNYHDALVGIVMHPLHGQKLIYLTPGGGFSFIFQITLFAGLIAAAPMLMYQIYAFLRPTLPSHAQRSTVKIALIATLLMAGGVCYGYFIAVPAALTFLSTFAGDSVLPSLTADSYLNFFLSYVAGLGLLFQLPLLLIFWHWIHPLTPGGVLKSERFVILLAFVAAALITPTPDAVNQTMIALPLILLYQFGVAFVLVGIVQARRAAKKSQLLQPHVIPKPLPRVIAQSPPPTITLPQPVRQSITTPPAQRQRTMDGFVPQSTIPTEARPQALTRPLQVPHRPTMVRHTLQHKPHLSIDGISPL
jgi:sec-independent protein translocase protein TatC